MTILLCEHFNLKKRKKVLEGEVILACQDCRMISVEGLPRWIDGDDPRVMDALRLLITLRNEEKARQDWLLNSPIEDPRWMRMYE